LDILWLSTARANPGGGAKGAEAPP